MADFYCDIVAILTENKCLFVHEGKGSHEIWRSSVNGKYITVPRSAKSRHTANEVLKQAGLAKVF